ncbi:MAG: hypothetical protein [Wigfec virus K19_143]|nr:MAG: hypothetical protein [Wigfec virus K19_143]
MRRRRRNSVNSAQRDAFPITSEQLFAQLYVRPMRSVLPDLLRRLEDRREFHPAYDYRRARGFSRLDQTAIKVRPVTRSSSGAHGVSRDVFRFAVPSRTLICVRRKERREVLFASGNAKGSRKPKRRNYYSGVSCR